MTISDFDFQPILTGKAIAVRPLAKGDFEALFAAASDPAIWAGHPAKDRYRREVFAAYFAFLLDSGKALIVLERGSRSVIGCSSYYVAPDTPDSVSIGFTFLRRSHWGGQTNFEPKRLMLDHAFRSVRDVWFHIDPTNVRSQKATAKLGAVHAYDTILDLSGTPVEWMCFRLGKADWDRTCEVAAVVSGRGR
ncbi:GNAT family N-acetyltransferase [Algihabitans sp.]|uniref:GNAT family N-acetyltransferase n=1 Tax=Algihabitans sp. TaxID=2821514 RepID=UPI003BA8C179